MLVASLLFAAQVSVAPPPWTIEHDVDPITDSEMIQIALAIDSAELRIGCIIAHRSPTYVMIVQAPRYLGNAAAREIIFRFDRDRPEHRVWRYADRMAGGRGDVIPLVNRMQTASRLVVRMADYEGAPVDLVFPLTGARAPIDELHRQCARLPRN